MLFTKKLVVLLIAWALNVEALAFQPAQQASTEIAFTPGNQIDALIINNVKKARQQILVQAFSFTHVKIAQSLIDAKARGVDVQLIADWEQTMKIPHTAIPKISAGGVPVYIDSQHASAHNKVIIIDPETDNAAVITGSFNFTNSAQHKNAENVVILRSESIAKRYKDNWDRHKLHSFIFRQPGDHF